VLTEDSAAFLRGTAHVRRSAGYWHLRVLVHVERAHDSNEIHPAWMANRDVWIDELQLLTGDAVRLEHVDESLAAGVESDARGAIVAALS
jgi:hypothetical protein